MSTATSSKLQTAIQLSNCLSSARAPWAPHCFLAVSVHGQLWPQQTYVRLRDSRLKTCWQRNETWCECQLQKDIQEQCGKDLKLVSQGLNILQVDKTCTAAVFAEACCTDSQLTLPRGPLRQCSSEVWLSGGYGQLNPTFQLSSCFSYLLSYHHAMYCWERFLEVNSYKFISYQLVCQIRCFYTIKCSAETPVFLETYYY